MGFQRQCGQYNNVMALTLLAPTLDTPESRTENQPSI
jgi:hypothetical protein